MPPLPQSQRFNSNKTVKNSKLIMIPQKFNTHLYYLKGTSGKKIKLK